MAKKNLDGMSRRTQMTAMHRGFMQSSNKHAVVNPPIYRASTFLFETFEEMAGRGDKAIAAKRYPYGLFGSDTVRQVEDMVAHLEGCEDAVASCSGMSACAVPLMTFLDAGDHLLITDSVYGPVRKLAEHQLKRLGIEVEYYDPLITPEELEPKIKPNTKMLYLESPGSVTFDIQDIRGLCRVAKQHGLITALDNTWATPIYYRPAEHGVDLVIHAATKYMGGASDLMMGLVAGPKRLVDKMAEAQGHYGFYTNPDDAYACIRGLRSMAVRMPIHLESSLIVAKHIQDKPEVAEILHPAMPGDRMHQRFLDQGFTGGGGLFSAIFTSETSEDFMAAVANNLQLFGMGYSWGGFESLTSYQNPKAIRTASDWPQAGMSDGPLIRFNIGLEDPVDICADIDQAFEAARNARPKGLLSGLFGAKK